jgi:phage terminase small subunit
MPRIAAAASLVFTGSEPAETRLQPPADLSPAEKAVFIDIVVTNRPDHFRPADALLLAAFTRAVCLERQASAALAVAGPVGADGKVSPWLHVLAQATKSILSLARLLRLSPQSRALLVPKDNGPASVYDRMRFDP